jgi:NADPH-dependent 2,4-dienoyl-CoA reductase/sulfur reductase-like enzyme
VQQLLPVAVAAGAGGRVSTLRQGRVELKYGCEVASIELAPQPDSQADGNAGSDAGSSKHSPALLLTLTGGEQVPADLVLLAIGVSPALEWVPARLQRAPDGGLKLDR